ncbi:MAG: GNAT family N-acetyltransferase, partial [Symploca sp. SIO2G7]|nr:GNAT family N-acetyltransferase [Symploca sp. SIO2G7]
AYAELGATQLGHLNQTVELYLKGVSTLWWLQKGDVRVGFTASQKADIGCLWLGQSINQLTGALQAYIYLVYVEPAYRRQGLGRGLVKHAKYWAQKHGYAQMSLQVFCNNKTALHLYKALGFTPTATLLTLDL